MFGHSQGLLAAGVLGCLYPSCSCGRAEWRPYHRLFPGWRCSQAGGWVEGFLDVRVLGHTMVSHVVLGCAGVPVGAVLDWTC